METEVHAGVGDHWKGHVAGQVARGGRTSGGGGRERVYGGGAGRGRSCGWWSWMGKGAVVEEQAKERVLVDRDGGRGVGDRGRVRFG